MLCVLHALFKSMCVGVAYVWHSRLLPDLLITFCSAVDWRCNMHLSKADCSDRCWVPQEQLVLLLHVVSGLVWGTH